MYEKAPGSQSPEMALRIKKRGSTLETINGIVLFDRFWSHEAKSH